MVREDVIAYFVEGRRRGFSFETLATQLRESGFSDEEITAARSEVEEHQLDRDAIEKNVDDSRRDGVSGPGVSSTEPFQKIRVEEEGLTPHFFQKIGLSFFKPVQLFHRTKNEKASGAILYWAAIALWPSLILALVGAFIFQKYFAWIVPLQTILPASAYTFLQNFSQTPFWTLFLVIFSAAIALCYLAGICIIGLSALLIHMFARMYGGDGKYNATYRAATYSLTPPLLLKITVLPLYFFLTFSTAFLTQSIVGGILFVWSFILICLGVKEYHRISGWRAFFACASALFVFLIIACGALLATFFL